jgi:hypothetical protein
MLLVVMSHRVTELMNAAGIVPKSLDSHRTPDKRGLPALWQDRL